MATTYTDLLGLPKHATTDPFDITLINDMADLTDAAVGKAYRGKAAYNWLVNSDFANLVNQRGQTSYAGTGYGIDRWFGRATYQKVEPGSDGVTVTATGTAYAGIVQKVLNISKLAGKTVTFACHLYSSVGAGLRFVNASGTALANITGNASATQTLVLTYTIPTDATTDSVIPQIVLLTSASGDYMHLYWAALYEGSYTADTLPDYQVKGYAAELMECQRDLWVCNNTFFSEGCGYAYSSTVIRVSIPTPQTLRITPTIIQLTNTSKDCYGIKYCPQGGSEQTPDAVECSVANNRIKLTLTGSFTTNDQVTLRLESTLAFSSEP